MKKIKLGKKEYMPSKVICVGKNYPLHIQEMGGSEKPSEPVIFIKPNSALVFDNSEIIVPENFGSLHYEVELCFVMEKTVKNVSEKEAKDLIAGYGVGIDFTLREVQSNAKLKGLPWTIAKCFDGSAAFGEFVDEKEIFDSQNIDLMLTVNDEVRQTGNTKDMLFSPSEIVSYVSKYMTIEEGDIFMTGTPHGVGEVFDGDRIFAEASNFPSINLKVKRP